MAISRSIRAWVAPRSSIACKRLALGGREERWELSGPRRRVLAEDVDQTRLIDLVSEPL